MGSLSLKSANFWVLVASVLAVMGFIALGVGWIACISLLKTAGQVLIAPIIIGGVLLILIVIPALIIANRRRRKKAPQARNDT